MLRMDEVSTIRHRVLVQGVSRRAVAFAPASTSFNARMICSSVTLLFLGKCPPLHH
jgi:hypothetical protein